jgi:hypothetical protein
LEQTFFSSNLKGRAHQKLQLWRRGMDSHFRLWDSNFSRVIGNRGKKWSCAQISLGENQMPAMRLADGIQLLHGRIIRNTVHSKSCS